MSIISVFLCFLIMITAPGQQKTKPQRGTYYHQKKTLFELLPDAANEIIFLGNSITDGCEWSELFSSLRVKNRGISADKSDGVLERLDEITASQPAQIFIMIGVNDLAAGRTPAEVSDNYREILNRIRQDSEKTEVFIQSVLPVNDAFQRFKKHFTKSLQIVELNTMLRKLADEYDLQYIDLHSAFSTSEGKLDPEYTNDGLHLTGAGYLLWKSKLTDYINI